MRFRVAQALARPTGAYNRKSPASDNLDIFCWNVRG